MPSSILASFRPDIHQDEELNLPYFSMPRGVAALDCDFKIFDPKTTKLDPKKDFCLFWAKYWHFFVSRKTPIYFIGYLFQTLSFSNNTISTIITGQNIASFVKTRQATLTTWNQLAPAE